ncbi:MAG: ABC transporter substrate-binding protein [Candidatus Nanoarchaeia archaeon]|nr:ABC transporter substrate-binding protein [Candidatus Nanoarchaeia archaeon]
MKINQIIVVGLILLTAMVFGITASGYLTLNKEEYIQVAYISSLSGEAGVWGESLKKGFDFAVEEINQQGGINGKLIKPIYEDDECDSRKGIDAYNKVIKINNVKIITGTVCSSVAMSVAPITQENRILYMASGATHPEVTKQGDLIFRIWTSDAYEAKEIAKFSVNNLELNSFGIIYFDDNPAGIALKENFEKTIVENNKKILISETINSKQMDFRTNILKIINQNPEGIYVVSTPEQMPMIVNQIKSLNYKGKILLYGPSALAQGTIEKINNKESIYYPLPIIINQKNFWKDYKEKTGEDADILVSGGYDSMMLIKDGLLVCGEDNECIRDYWLSLKDYPTTRGNISYDETGDVTGIDYEIKELN